MNYDTMEDIDSSAYVNVGAHWRLLNSGNQLPQELKIDG